MQRLKQHPDLGGDHWNAALINEAYRVLTDPASRERYDDERQLILRGMSSEPSDDAADEDEMFDDSAVEAAESPDPDPVCPFCLTPHDRKATKDSRSVCPNCASPLCPAREWHLEHTGQRAINRIPTHLSIAFYTTWPQPTACVGQALDVSPNGMRFISDRRLGEGRRVKITSDVIDAIALVTHCEHESDTNRWIVGVVFETLRLASSQGAFFSTEA